MSIGIGIGIPFGRRKSGAAIDAQAQAHFDRVIADGGLVPSGLSGVNNFFTTVKSIYGTSDITTAISVGLDAQVLGYKLGAGAGTTLGQAAQKLYSCSGSSGDVVQTTAASQPLLLTHTTGQNYWFGSGVTGNDVSTPNAAANNFSTTMDIIVKAAPSNWSGNFIPLIAKNIDNTAGNVAFYFMTISGKRLYLQIGSQTATSSVGHSFNDNETGWVRVTYNGTTQKANFYTSTDGTSWSLLGTEQNILIASVPSINTTLTVGLAKSLNIFTGKIYRATISNSIGGAPVVDFNPNQYNPSTSQTQWTSSTGEVWTINVGTATTGYKGQIVTKTTIQGDGVDDLMQSGTIASQSICTNYLSVNPLNLNIAKYYLGSSVGDGNIIYSTVGSTRFGNATPFNEIVFSNVLANRLSLLTAVGNASSSLVFTNNANQVSGTVGSGSFSNVRLFAPQQTSLLGNAIISTFILAKQADNSTNRTAIYNYIRSINGNAF